MSTWLITGRSRQADAPARSGSFGLLRMRTFWRVRPESSPDQRLVIFSIWALADSPGAVSAWES
jgi:hypothetical protein